MTSTGHRRLILTRHAKSAWDNTALDDHDRPLNSRGRRAALELGEWLDSRGYEPDQVLCSPAQRTRETWTKVSAAPLEVMPRVEYLPALYPGTPEVMLDALRRANGECVMMIGHNPAIAAFAASLPAQPPVNPDFGRYPTSATLVVDFQIDHWREITPGSGSVLDFFVPSGRG